MSNYATKKLIDAIGVDISNLRDFIVLKAEFNKLVVNKLVSIPNNFITLKRKVDGLDVERMTTLPVDFKKVSDIVSKEVAKNTKFNKVNTKVNNLENKIPDVSNLI